MNVPDWKPDETLITCPKCGYACKPEWGDTCAMCDAPLTGDAPTEESEEPEETIKEKEEGSEEPQEEKEEAEE